MIIQEQIRKKVVGFGNGSIVYTPKDWIGREVVITLPKLPLKEEILDVLSSYFPYIEGVYLYGSYARNEQEKDSDVDILVIADKKFKIERKGFEVNVHTLESLRRNLEENPLYLLILKEAKIIFNGNLLEEFKKRVIKKKEFRNFLEDTERILKIDRGIIDLEKKVFEESSVIYSLILRLRGLYMMGCLLRNKKYGNKDFKEFMNKNKISKDFFKIYRGIRDNKKNNKVKVKKEEVEKLYFLVKNETEKKSKEIY